MFSIWTLQVFVLLCGTCYCTASSSASSSSTWGYSKYDPSPQCTYSSPQAGKSGYTEYGPYCWSTYSSTCSSTSQSPINIDNAIATAPGKFESLSFKTSQSCTSAAIFNSGTAWKVSFENSCSNFFGTHFQGKEYHLENLVFHSPSEHTIGGARFDGELQLVHQTTSHEYLIVSVLFKSSSQEESANNFLNFIWGEGTDPSTGITNNKTANFTTIGDDQQMVTLSRNIDPYKEVIPSKPTYYAYKGSLTYPPCTENVWWAIMAQPLLMSSSQVSLFREGLSKVNNDTTNIDSYGKYANSRPPQPKNGRSIYYFGGGEEGHGSHDSHGTETHIFFGSILMPIAYAVSFIGLVLVGAAGLQFALSLALVFSAAWGRYILLDWFDKHCQTLESKSWYVRKVAIISLNLARFRFLKVLCLVLEVLVAADVIDILVTPLQFQSWEIIGKIGIVVVIRTVLGYHLSHEFEILEAETAREKKMAFEKNHHKKD